MNEHPASEEIGLRDVYLVLQRWRVLVVALPVVTALLTLLVVQFLPRQYESRGVYSLSAGSDKLAAPLNNLPPLAGLAQGYSDALSSTALTEELGEPEPWEVFKARFDDKRGVWTLTANGPSPQLARERAERLMKSARNYLEDRLVGILKTNLSGTLEQARLDLDQATRNLKGLDGVLATTPQYANRDAATVAGLEGQGTGPQPSRATNPAFVSLSLQQSQLKMQRASAQARLESLGGLLNDNTRLRAFVGQAFVVQTLAPPSVPVRPESPRPLLFTALAGVLGLLLGLIVPFLIEAVRDPSTSGNLARSTARVQGEG